MSAFQCESGQGDRQKEDRTRIRREKLSNEINKMNLNMITEMYRINGDKCVPLLKRALLARAKK
jgi:hypothetical protein